MADAATASSSYRIHGATGDWEVVIGLEVHAQIATEAKLFSGVAAFKIEVVDTTVLGHVLVGRGRQV